jgi:hypothetical protein
MIRQHCVLVTVYIDQFAVLYGTCDIFSNCPINPTINFTYCPVMTERMNTGVGGRITGIKKGGKC